jgi:Zn-dependent M28 family amino/carboxypeptidase
MKLASLSAMSGALIATAALAACAAGPGGNVPVGTEAAATAPSAEVDPARLSEYTRVLASDEFQGRAPGTEGETKTIAYLTEQFQKLGLEPGGENGGWTQRVPLIRTQVQTPAKFTIAGARGSMALQSPRDVYVSTVRPVERARIESAPLVFVGYGVSAPERQWDDFKGVDLKGKVAVFLVNDPDFEAGPGDAVAGSFGGRTMTYYGRWTYKYEEAARRGAIGALIVHETAGAAYGWSTVEAPGGVNYNVVLPPDAQTPVLLQGWIQRSVAGDLFRRAGLDFETVKRQARTAAFRPIDLKARLSTDISVKLDRIESHNVIAKLTGTKRPGETIMYAAHWDSFGVGPADAQGRTVRPGAVDDALGLAGVLEIARLFKAGSPPERTQVFAAWTTEERGLLGAEHYSAQPLFPLEKTVANFTLDVLQTAGPARDFVLIGRGQNTLEDELAEAAARQGRAVTPDAAPERGLFYRADHFALAKRGVPVLLVMALGGGVDLIEGGRAAGEKWVSDYTANCYHQPCDAWSPDWDLRGAAQDVALVYAMGRKLAGSNAWPSWKPGSEFKDVRERSAAARAN